MDNQQIVRDVLSRNPKGLNYNDLKRIVTAERARLGGSAKFTFSKVLDPMVAREEISVINGIYILNPAYVGPVGGGVAPFVPRTLMPDEALKFLIYILRNWVLYCHSRGAVGDLHHGGIKAYLHPTDEILLSAFGYHGLTPSQQLYMSFALHAQNDKTERVINFLHGNEPSIRLWSNNYGAGGRPTHFDDIVAGRILVSPEWQSYARTMVAIYNYIYAYEVHPRTIADVFLNFYTPFVPLPFGTKIRETYNEFQRIIPGTRFKKALTFDLLKEQSYAGMSFDFPKPDRHLRRVMYCLWHTGPWPINPHLANHNLENEINEFECMDFSWELLENIRHEYVAHGGTHGGDITCYLLDKTIYQLCCRKPFYLPADAAIPSIGFIAHANRIRRGIIDRDYNRIVITPADIVLIDSLL